MDKESPENPQPRTTWNRNRCFSNKAYVLPLLHASSLCALGKYLHQLVCVPVNLSEVIHISLPVHVPTDEDTAHCRLHFHVLSLTINPNL
jgi:hypothetical protein